MQPNTPAAPLPLSERLTTVDALRGLALLGILLMNILEFAAPHSSVWTGNPALPHPVTGAQSGLSYAIWMAQHLFFEGRMRAIFSFMFGVSMFLLVTRAEQRGQPAADIHYRRMLWLLLFGAIHGYLIWDGDVLYSYAMCGLVLYPLRLAKPRYLIAAATVMIAAMTVWWSVQASQEIGLRDRALAAAAQQKAGKTLTAAQSKDLEEWVSLRKRIYGDKEAIAKELKQLRGNYFDVVKARAGDIMNTHAFNYYSGWGMDVLSMMLIGMAAAISGWVQGTLPAGTYLRRMGWCYVTGLGMAGVMVWQCAQYGYEPLAMQMAQCTYEVHRVLVALGHIHLFLYIAAQGWLTKPLAVLAAVGQTAFSNYILTSILGGFVFYGYGLGMVDRLTREQVYLVVLGIWTINLVVSPWWLRRYRFGPLEWVWRSLTYWERQPLRREAPTATGS